MVSLTSQRFEQMPAESLNKVRDIIVGVDASIVHALECLDKSGRQIILVVEADGRLVGTVTDGDVRRGLLRGVSLQTPVRAVMKDRPISIAQGLPPSEALAQMRAHSVRQLPVINSAGSPVGLYLLDELLGVEHENVLAVVMAGGLGSRLRPITETVPKPLIQIGGRPLLETTITMLAAQGYRDVVLCVNYMADVIRRHFGDGSQFGVSIEYVEEHTKMGTAGALSLLPKPPRTSVLVLNGDILTTTDYTRLMDFHRAQQSPLTVCVREFQQQIPYGVVKIEGERLVSIEEKPTYSSFVNAGIYVLEPSAIALLERGAPCDMPRLIENVGSALGAPTVYPLREYWLDIGRIEDLRRAQEDYDRLFA